MMGFLAPWFLAGLAALGVPVFVHLLRRHVTTPRPVSSLMFFERGTQSSTRHRRLRYLLLFALRAALILLLILAFANPFIHRRAADPNSRLLLIVVDRSFSMRAGNRLADARQQALALIARKPHPQKAQIIALGGQLDLLTQPTADAAQLSSAIESIEPGDGHASFGELGRTVRALAETIRTPVDLHLFSDLQRSAIPANFADMVFPPTVTLNLHPLANGPPTPNWTVESVDAPADLADPKDPKHSRVRAVIAGFATPSATKSVSLLVNGKTLATRSVNIPPSGRATIEFAPLDVGYGLNKCEVRIAAADTLPADDTTFFAVRRSDPERVLFVHPAAETRSTLYFGAALSAAAPRSFLLQSVAAEQTTDLDPSKFAFVVLSDAQTLPAIFQRSLAQFVAKGGSVMISLGTRAGHHARIPLWDADVTDVHDYLRSGHTATVGQVDFTHPALQQSSPGRDNGGWADTPFFYAAVVDPAGARVAARLSDGTPLLLDRQLGEGHLLLFTSGLDNLTNDLPLHPVFVALIDRSARFLSGNDRLSGFRLVDSFVQLRSSSTPVGQLAGVEVLDPQGHRALSLSEARSAQSLRLGQAGFYSIHLGNGRDALLGVNPDRRESDLAPMPPDIQQLWIGGSSPAPSPESSPSVPAATPSQRTTLWWYVMLLALVVAIAETALSSRYMGTQREEA
jgi:hypothetical protein